MTSLQSNDFELFDLPARFAQDRAAIDARWKALQREAHPDRFAAEDATAQRLALQWSVRINEAYQRLKDPQKRAAYLCELNGSPIAAHTNTSMPGAFLMLQMSWREALEDASGVDELEAIGTLAQSYKKLALARIEAGVDLEHDYTAAAGEVRALMFVEKFLAEVHTRIEQAENAAAAKGQ